MENRINIKNIDWLLTILANVRLLGMPAVAILYLYLCLGALNNVIVTEPLLKLPFIIIISYSAINLIYTRMDTNVSIYYKTEDNYKNERLVERLGDML
jgi:hypothetical protein